MISASFAISLRSLSTNFVLFKQFDSSDGSGPYLRALTHNAKGSFSKNGSEFIVINELAVVLEHEDTLRNDDLLERVQGIYHAVLLDAPVSIP